MWGAFDCRVASTSILRLSSVYPYVHMNREARVWLKIVMNCLIYMFHFTKVKRYRVCLVYALMKDLPINVEAVLKSSIRKARVH